MTAGSIPRRTLLWLAAGLAVLMAALPGVARLASQAAFVSSVGVTGNTVGPLACTTASSWTTKVTALTGLTDWLRLGETSGTSAADAAASSTGAWTYSSNVTFSQPGALFCQGAAAGNAVTMAATTTRLVSPSAGNYAGSGVNAYSSGVSYSLWFNATTTSPGRLFGLGSDNKTTGSDSTGNYTDRVLWVSAAGQIHFDTISGDGMSSAAGFQDGRWHHVVVTMTASTASLYVDGALVGQDSAVSYYGFGSNVYWRVGQDNASSSSRHPKNAPLDALLATVDEVVVARSTLSAAAVAALYVAGDDA
jgi:hypothetical protein